MSKELPKDVIVDILSRLPVRSILRFKSVSKSWYSLFQNPSFIAIHFQNQTTISDPSFLFTPHRSISTPPADRDVCLILSDSGKSIKIPIQIDIPFLNISKPLRVSGTCNGLICLSIFPIASIILLWNPATRVFKDLPISRIDRPPQAGPIKVVLGCGFDHVADDYKVLRIVYYGYPSNQVEMYSLSTNSWREIKTRVQFLIFESACSVFLNGRFHWTAIGFEEMHGKKLIVSFDFRDEAFHYIMPPEFDFGVSLGEDPRISKISWTVVELKESLAVIGSSGFGSGMMFEVWVMKEYGVVSSWTKYRWFDLQTKVSRLLGCGLKGEFLLENEDKQLIVYDSYSQRVKFLGNHGVASWSEVFNHVGSLLPINGGKIVQRTNLSAVVPDACFVRKMDLSIEVTPQPLMQNPTSNSYQHLRPRFTTQSQTAVGPLLMGEEQNKGLEKLRKEIYNPGLQRASLYYRNYYDSQTRSRENDDSGKRCAVCLDDFEARETVTLTPCNHMFHDKCIVPWVRSHGQCPVCRFVISERKETTRTSISNELGNDPFARDLITFIRDMETRG